MSNSDNMQILIESVLHQLATDAEGLLLVATAIEDRASDVSMSASPQHLREIAALVKAAAIQTGLTAANVVGSAERLRLIAELGELDEQKSNRMSS